MHLKNEKFLIHAVVLSIAGFVSRIISVLYAVPIYHIIGEEGNGYYGTACEIYNIILLLTAYSMPIAISKVMSVYVAEQDYVNCNRLFKASLVYVFVICGIGSLVSLFYADSLVIPEAVPALKLLAPAIFFYGILSVFRGYVQAHNNMVPTAISQIIEQLFNAGFSILFAYLFMNHNGRFIELGKALVGIGNGTTGEVPRASLGAAGNAAGTLVGVLVAGIFMGVYLVVTKKKRKGLLDKQHKTKGAADKESYFSLIRVIFVYTSPIILTSFIYNLSTTIDMKIFWNWAELRGVATEEAAKIFGIYSRQVLVLVNLPIAIASSIATSMMPTLSVSNSIHDIDAMNAKVSKAVRATVMIAMPSVIGLALLAEPIMQLLFKGTGEIAAESLIRASISVLFFSVATVLNSVLQAMGKSFIAIKNVSTALILHIIYVVGALKDKGEILEVLVVGSIIYSAFMCLLNIKSIGKCFGARVKMVNLIERPLIASLIMGVVTVVTMRLLDAIGLSNLWLVCITVIVSAGFYMLTFGMRDEYVNQEIFSRR